jgi:hypothetical protein
MPVRLAGVIVADIASGKAKYVPYPAVAGPPPTYDQMGVLPDQNGKHLVYLSLGSIETGRDACQVQLLDLDTLEWEQQPPLDWLVYQIGGDDLQHTPWVLLGSRAKESTAEPGRSARLALFHPDTKIVEQLPMFGDVIWNQLGDFKLDPHGKYLVYIDGRRKGIVRYELATGKLDIDPRWYSHEGKLLVDADASTVLLIKDNTVMRAEWKLHEDLSGHAE